MLAPIASALVVTIVSVRSGSSSRPRRLGAQGPARRCRRPPAGQRPARLGLDTDIDLLPGRRQLRGCRHVRCQRAFGFGLIETLSGGSWQATEAPVVTGAVAEELVAVSCPSVGNCVATGAYRDGAMNQFGLLATESGGTWTAVACAPPPGAAADPGLDLLSMSCPAPGQLRGRRHLHGCVSAGRSGAL